MPLVLLRAFAYLTDLMLVVSNQQHVILSLRVALTRLVSPSSPPQNSDAGACAHIGTEKKSLALIIDPNLIRNSLTLTRSTLH